MLKILECCYAMVHSEPKKYIVIGYTAYLNQKLDESILEYRLMPYDLFNSIKTSMYSDNKKLDMMKGDNIIMNSSLVFKTKEEFSRYYNKIISDL